MKLASLTLLLAAAAGMARAGETGLPYLYHPATTRTALASEVRADSRLRARYAKHFGLAEADICRQLDAATPSSLPPGEYTVWLTTSDGLRYPTEQTRTAPTSAFRLSGQTNAYLEAGTGNPIAPFQPVDVVVKLPAPPAPVVEKIVTKEVLVPVETGSVSDSKD